MFIRSKFELKRHVKYARLVNDPVIQRSKNSIKIQDQS